MYVGFNEKETRVCKLSIQKPQCRIDWQSSEWLSNMILDSCHSVISDIARKISDSHAFASFEGFAIDYNIKERLHS